MSPGIIRTKPQTPAHTGSDFTELAATIRGSGLLRRRYGYYWTKLVAVPVVLTAAVLAFIWIGDTWWQLFTAVGFAVLFTQIAMLGHDAAHRQIFVSGRWNDWIVPHPRRPVRRHELRLVAAQAHPSSCEPEQDRRRPRHRSSRHLLHPRAGACPALARRPVARGAPGSLLLPDPPARGALAARVRRAARRVPREARAPLGRDRLPHGAAHRLRRRSSSSCSRPASRSCSSPCSSAVRRVHGHGLRAQSQGHAARSEEREVRLPARARC